MQPAVRAVVELQFGFTLSGPLTGTDLGIIVGSLALRRQQKAAPEGAAGSELKKYGCDQLKWPSTQEADAVTVWDALFVRAGEVVVAVVLNTNCVPSAGAGLPEKTAWART